MPQTALTLDLADRPPSTYPILPFVTRAFLLLSYDLSCAGSALMVLIMRAHPCSFYSDRRAVHIWIIHLFISLPND